MGTDYNHVFNLWFSLYQLSIGLNRMKWENKIELYLLYVKIVNLYFDLFICYFSSSSSSIWFRGTSGIDIDLRRVDIDQCPQKKLIGVTLPLNIFAGTDKCKQRTTEVSALCFIYNNIFICKTYVKSILNVNLF